MTEQNRTDSASLREEIHAASEEEVSVLVRHMENLQHQLDEIKKMLERR